MTEILSKKQINKAVQIIKSGNLVALPTETVYGLAADASNETAIKKIFYAKNRPLNHPLIIHVSSLDMAKTWCSSFPESARELADRFWPGPLTMILPHNPNMQTLATANLPTVALRMPSNSIMLEIIDKLGKGVAAPSANLHKKTSPTTAMSVFNSLNGRIPAILDGGRCSIGLESTILDLTREVPIILRPGNITAEQISQSLKNKVLYKSISSIKLPAPGCMNDHYQPNKPLFILEYETILDRAKNYKNIAFMHYSEIKQTPGNKFYKMPRTKNEYAYCFYEILHQIDKTEVDMIIVERPPSIEGWVDVNDRLEKSFCKT